MADRLIKSETLADIANAIRERTEKTDKISPAQFAEEIRTLEMVDEYDGSVTVDEGATVAFAEDYTEGYNEGYSKGYAEGSNNSLLPATPTGPTDNRTDLAYWYQYLGHHYDSYIDENASLIYPQPTFELEYPKGTQNVTSFANMFAIFVRNDETLYYEESHRILVTKLIGTLDCSSAVNLNGVFGYQPYLTDVGNIINTSNVKDFGYMFAACNEFTSIPELDTSNGTNFNGMVTSCIALISMPELDFRNAISVSSIVFNCKSLTSARFKNLKVSIQIGSGTSWGHLINVDDLIFTIYHLRDTGSSKTFTIGSANLEKLANVYVRTIDITDEMRAEDDLIDEKLPFEVCESTDEGAILIKDYVLNKNWSLK